ncbi:MAG: 3-isopropylmalate dehydratase small subunit [Chloroflexi bacterium]|nr:3-isopropylmalate dehydratase small subunit [Chloroflexota bacterium]
MDKFQPFKSQIVPLPVENIDTDQIIPARFLKVTDKSSLAEGLFADWRENSDFILNDERYEGAQVLLGGHNFGCGSSREHAPWALKSYGFQAVISTYFADIFRNNALKNGLLPIVVDEETHAALLQAAEVSHLSEVHVDLESQTLTLPDGKQVEFPIDSFAKECLLAGVDELGYLMNKLDAVEAYEVENPARVDTTVLINT